MEKPTCRGSSAAPPASSISTSPGDAPRVFDGLEPAERFSESIQFEFFEYVYHHVLRQDDEWAAREWLREHIAPTQSR